MFTGIITAVGTVSSTMLINGDMRATIDVGTLDLTDVTVGDSISVNGVCLTVIEVAGNCFTADISAETLSCTNFAMLTSGMHVNLEKAMQATARLHGHIVTGHIDGTGRVLSIEPDARSIRVMIEIPDQLTRYVCKKGSVCIDGVSLTVNAVDDRSVSVNIIPHTMQQTRFAGYCVGTTVNIEVDIIARYLERLQTGGL
jgi:riboflavin synthase